MWVEDIEQLQAVNTNLSGQYALRNSIDATATQDWNDQDTSTDVKEGFASVVIRLRPLPANSTGWITIFSI